MGSHEEFITITYFEKIGSKQVMKRVDAVDSDGTVLYTVEYGDKKTGTTSESPAPVQQPPTSMTPSTEPADLANFKILVLHLNIT